MVYNVTQSVSEENLRFSSSLMKYIREGQQKMKVCTKVWKKIDKGLLAAFAIPTLLMLVLFMIQGIYPFGSRSFLYMDMYHQYMTFFSEFVEKAVQYM